MSNRGAMPPYSTDPALSLSRHADSEYENSSDPVFLSSDHAIPSSPPPADDDEVKMTDLYAARAQSFDRMDVEDDPTDEDEDDGMRESTVTRSQAKILARRLGSGGPPMKYASGESTTGQFVPVRASRTASLQRSRAERAINALFEGIGGEINLEDCGFTAVPEACRALVHHVDLTPRLYSLNLSKNEIRLVDAFLYRIERLKYLNLRGNAITELTGEIGKLKNLRELHLGHNKLKTLPIELLEIRALDTLTTHPNDFAVRPEGWRDSRASSVSLKELASRAIMRSSTDIDFENLRRLLSEWEKVHPDAVAPILEAVQVGRVCTECKRLIVRPWRTVLVWFKHPADRSGNIAPYQSTLCSERCMDEANEAALSDDEFDFAENSVLGMFLS